MEENIRYAEFMEQNLSMFQAPMRERRQLKPNLMMSRYIKTRNSDQCRSHHQKMMKYHRTVPEIIAYIKDLKERYKEGNDQKVDLKVKIEDQH